MFGILVNMIGRNKTANGRSRINVGETSDYGSGIQNGIAADFHIIAEHCAEFLQSGFDMFIFVFHNDQGFIAFNVTGYSACSHMGLVSEYGIADIIVMRNLNIVE